MSVRVTCGNPACGKPLSVPEEAAHKRVRCPACGQVMTVPAVTSDEPKQVSAPKREHAYAENEAAAARKMKPRKKRRRKKRTDDDGGESFVARTDPGMLGLATVGVLFLIELVVLFLAHTVGAWMLFVSGIILLVGTTLWLLWEAAKDLGWDPKANVFLIVPFFLYGLLFIHINAILNLGTTWKGYFVWWFSLVFIGAGIFLGPMAADLPLPGIQSSAKQNLNNLKALGLAVHNYRDTFGHFPQDITDKSGTPLLSWRVELLPFLEQDSLYRMIKRDEPWDSPANKPALAKMPEVLRRPGRDKPGGTETHFQGFAGKGTMFEPGLKIRAAAVRDGLSQTLLLVEADEAVPWTKPGDLPYDPNRPLPRWGGQLQDDKINVVFADGMVKQLAPKKLDEKIWRALITRDGAEPVDIDKLE